MKIEKQFEGFVNPSKPVIENGGIYFPVSVEHIDLKKYHGDARSFGYNFDDGLCTVVEYEQVVGALAEDTLQLIDECKVLKNKRSPDFDILENNDSDLECNAQNSELLIKYGRDSLYKDGNGFWAHTYYCSDDYQGSVFRVTDESAELFRAANKEYQDGIRLYNSKYKEASENLELLKQTVKA